MLSGMVRPETEAEDANFHTPVINIINQAQVTEHSHAFAPKKHGDLKAQLEAALTGIAKVTSKMGAGEVIKKWDSNNFS